MSVEKKISARARMAKSANVERDAGGADVASYIPTGRALDVIRRIAMGVLDAGHGRAFSITGPYGSGKSSFAVFLYALFGELGDPNFKQSHKKLCEAEPELGKLWLSARKSFGEKTSVSRAFATASTEPLSKTLERAISEFKPSEFKKTDSNKDVNVVDSVREIVGTSPLVILIDEFGKNLEAFGEENAAGDPYLLQEIAELSQGANPLPIVLITMQHLAFDEYVMGAGNAQRREWAKVQGRFHDIGFVDSLDQSFVLISSAFDPLKPSLAKVVDAWYLKNRKVLKNLGLESALKSAQSAFPLHPISVMALPDLCARFGQSERTLFSFLAGSEPNALPAIEFEATAKEIRFVGLGAIYDYFVGSAGSFIGASHSASRWIEVETRIRDASGLKKVELELLKSVGVLNLLSAGGQMRASDEILKRLWQDTISFSESFDEALATLTSLGLVTYREFADEYRVWSGSDFNLKVAIDAERRSLVDVPTHELLASVVELEPVVAGRHSQTTGVLRVFPRLLVGSQVSSEQIDSLPRAFDGQILLANEVLPEIEEFKSSKPIIVAQGHSELTIREVAVEVEALSRVLHGLKQGSQDWVAIQELGERLSFASSELEGLIEEHWSPTTARWYLYRGVDGLVELPQYRTLSALLSDVSDEIYSSTPRVANEMISRRELTSQGAKARRTLVDALFANSGQEQLGLEGYGPERAIYESIVKTPGFHSFDKKVDSWILQDPHNSEWKKVWSALTKEFVSSRDKRKSLTELVDKLSLPPFGLKDGVLGLLSALLVAQHANNFALYEYGSLVISVDGAVIERMLRNPDVFSIRNTGVTEGPRYETVQALRSRLLMSEDKSGASFLNVARALFREMRALEPFTQQTDLHLSSSAREVRRAFKEAVEPDILIFETLPLALGMSPIPVSAKKSQIVSTQEFANALVDSILEMKNAYEQLISRCLDSLGSSLAVSVANSSFRERLHGQAVNVIESIIQPKLKTFAYALGRDSLDDRAWLENIAMVVNDGIPPRMWTDEQESKFQLQIAELGANFRRLQALLYERLATSEEGFISRRITVTWPNGQEISESVALSHHELSVVRETLGNSVERLTELFGSEIEARKALAAWIWIQEDEMTEVSSPKSRDEESVSG